VKKALAGIVALGLVSAVSAQSLTKVPVHNKPVWQVVSGLPDAPGSPVPVRSLATDQVLGVIPMDARFLAFGTNGQITTLAINGEMAYVPSVAASPLYPQVPKVEVPPPGPNTLEELAEEYVDRVEGRAGVSLTLTDSLAEKANQGSMTGQGAIATMPGSDFAANAGINPYGVQPGAALATGGVQGIGQMVNSQPQNFRK